MSKQFLLANKLVRRSNFTLVELLVVVAILSILAALLLPTLQQAINNAKASDCSNRIRQIGLTMNVYADNWNEYFTLPAPVNAKRQTWDSLYWHYLQSYDVYRCPSSDLPGNYRQYILNGFLTAAAYGKGKRSTYTKTSQIYAFMDSSDSRNAAGTPDKSQKLKTNLNDAENVAPIGANTFRQVGTGNLNDGLVGFRHDFCMNVSFIDGHTEPQMEHESKNNGYITHWKDI